MGSIKWLCCAIGCYISSKSFAQWDTAVDHTGDDVVPAAQCILGIPKE